MIEARLPPPSEIGIDGKFVEDEDDEDEDWRVGVLAPIASLIDCNMPLIPTFAVVDAVGAIKDDDGDDTLPLLLVLRTPPPPIALVLPLIFDSLGLESKSELFLVNLLKAGSIAEPPGLLYKL